MEQGYASGSCPMALPGYLAVGRTEVRLHCVRVCSWFSGSKLWFPPLTRAALLLRWQVFFSKGPMQPDPFQVQPAESSQSSPPKPLQRTGPTGHGHPTSSSMYSFYPAWSPSSLFALGFSCTNSLRSECALFCVLTMLISSHPPWHSLSLSPKAVDFAF